jgi:uncharacterized damage-inducible protein DinB
VSSALPEVWLRGSLPDIPALLQPIAHALLQAREEVEILMIGFPEELLWHKPAGVASVGFHLQHLTGVLDRLFTYAEGKPLNENQLSNLRAEGLNDQTIRVEDLIFAFRNQVDSALNQLRHTQSDSLTDVRGVGRAQLPSTVIGLLTHAAEHTMRHVGQLHVTVKWCLSHPT